MAETIELLKPYTPEKMQWPAMHQQKIDGVPVYVVRGTEDNKAPVTAYSRQGEKVTSIPHVIRFCEALLMPGDAVVMELHVRDMPFKEISGLVRKKVPTEATQKLRGWAFDFIPRDAQEGPWEARRRELRARLMKLAEIAGTHPDALLVRLLPGVVVNNQTEAEEAHNALMLAEPNCEGSVYHSLAKTWQPAKRLWTTQKLKPVPTIDLTVVGFEEAISADGQPLNMVGRVNAQLWSVNADGSPKCTVIGIGPGALTHAERKELWRTYKAGNWQPRIAEIKYMRDDSYDALRQPTFVCWRDDKETADDLQSLRP